MNKYSIKLYLLLLTSFFLLNCPSNATMDKKQNTVSKGNYEKDKKHIADCFFANIEFYRMFHRYDLKVYVDSPDSVKTKYESHYSKFPGAEKDPANFFEPYASRYDALNRSYVNSSFASKEQLNITTDTIIYSNDLRFCVAFLVIHLGYYDVEGLEAQPSAGREFDAMAIIGYRESVEAQFDIFPLTKHKVVGFERYDAAILMLKDLYFNHLKGIGSTGTVYEGEKFRHNVDDENFFSLSPYFKMHSSGLYNFQMYRHLGHDQPYIYVSCNESSRR